MKANHSLHLLSRALQRLGQFVLWSGLALLALHLVLTVVIRPSNERDWNADQMRLPIVAWQGDFVQINNVRNAVYRSTTDFDVRWESRRFELNRLNSLWFVVEPFSGWRGPAHTFLSFGFNDGEFVSISVEIRKEKGEAFSPLKGLLRQYELMYVVGDERDLIGLRANHRHDDVFLYPIRTSPEKMQALFRDMLKRANDLANHPEFYNTINNTCTTNIVDHINAIAPKRVPYSFKTLLPAHSDDLAFDLGLIDTKLDRANYRRAYQINALAKKHDNEPDFSTAIRRDIKRLPKSTTAQ